MAIIRRPTQRGEVTGWGMGSSFFPDVASMRQEIDRLFDQMVGGITGDTNLTVPPVDIIERENEFVVRAELPGVRKEDVKITLTNDVLTIRGEKKREEEVEEKNYHRRELATGSFHRSFTMPSSVQAEKIDATFENGVLTVMIPKAEEAKPREIQVRVRGEQQRRPS